jgi:hypothetical protein
MSKIFWPAEASSFLSGLGDGPEGKRLMRLLLEPVTTPP